MRCFTFFLSHLFADGLLKTCRLSRFWVVVLYLMHVKQNFPPVCHRQRLKTGNGGRVRGEELAELLVGASVMGCAACCVIGVWKRAVLVGQRCSTPGGEARSALLLQTQEVGRDGGCQGAPCYPSTDTGCLGGWCCSRGLWCSPAAGPGAPRGMFCVLGHALLVLPALCAQLIPRSSRRAPARLLGGAVPTARQSVLDKRPPGASRALGACWQEHNAAPAAVAVTDGALTAPGETGSSSRSIQPRLRSPILCPAPGAGR